MAINFIKSALRSSPSLTFCRNLSSSTSPMLIQFTPCLWAEPLKKKKRLDPAIVKAREERRKKKVEKQIRRLEKNQQQLKPIEEIEVPFELLDDKGKRIRQGVLSPERLDEIAVIKKDWARYCTKKHMDDVQMFDRIISSQTKALNQLRMESEELYQAAVQIDEKLLPFSILGPVDSPPIKNYASPDGEYLDVSKKWQ